jgi:hypothetical protein
MNAREFLELKNQLPALRRQLVDSSHGRIPKSVEHLERSISSAASRDDKAALYGLILSECSYFRNEDLTVHFLRQQVRDLPDDPFSLTSLATDLVRNETTRGEALALVAQAVALAKKQKRQVKYSLTCQARIALEVEDYGVFSKALRGLIEDAKNHRAEDHGFEFDFLDRADPGKVDQTLVSRYRALAP